MVSDTTMRRPAASRVWAAMSADAAALLFVSIAWIIAIILVNPIGEFPVVDDWAYLGSVRGIVERGELVFSDFAAQNLLSHLLWGSLFALPFGASYTALRFATLVAALLAAFALYQLVRNAGWGVSVALFAALALLFNPIFFPLSFGFMTDVPFVAAQTGAMLFLLASLASGSRATSGAGWFLALAAQLSRQTGFAIPIAYAAAYLIKHGVTFRRIVIAVLPLLAFIGLQWGYEYWLAASGKASLAYGKTMNTVLPRLTGSPSVLAGKVWEVCRYAFFYLGLFLLPISIPLLAGTLHKLQRNRAVLLALGIVIASVGLIAWSFHARLVMPIWPHTWKKTGVGADNHDVSAPQAILDVVTALSIIGGVCLVVLLAYGAYRLLARQMTGSQATGFAFGIVAAAAFAGSISLVAPVFDRYLLPLIPCLALALVCSVPPQATLPRWSRLVSGGILAAMALYVVVSAHNYTAEKRTYMTAIADLVDQGIPRDTIDAGWVWNGEHGFGRFKSEHYYKGWYRSRDYVVTVRQREQGYLLLRRYDVPRWQIWGRPGWTVNAYTRQIGQ